MYRQDIILKLKINQSDLEISVLQDKLKTTASDGLRTVFVEMCKHIYEIEYPSKTHISFYDQVYKVINKEIEKYDGDEPKLVHWLSKESKAMAKKEFESNPIPSISSIEDPTKLVEVKYPDVNFEYFHNKIMRLKSKNSLKKKKDTSPLTHSTAKRRA